MAGRYRDIACEYCGTINYHVDRDATRTPTCTGCGNFFSHNTYTQEEMDEIYEQRRIAAIKQAKKIIKECPSCGQVNFTTVGRAYESFSCAVCGKYMDFMPPDEWEYATNVRKYPKAIPMNGEEVEVEYEDEREDEDEEVLNEKSIELNMRKTQWVICPAGCEEGRFYCGNCHGTGWAPRYPWWSQYAYIEPCPICYKGYTTCEMCKGKGEIEVPIDEQKELKSEYYYHDY